MKRATFAALALLSAIAAPLPASAALHNLSNLFVFGDSLSDGGNSGLLSQAATGGLVTFPPPPYFNGHYSNGPVAVEYLWQRYNPGDNSFRPSAAGGTNYAIGGATTGLESFNLVNPNVPPALQPVYAQKSNAWQLDTFAAQNPVFDPATSLFVVWLFPNDVFYANTTGALPGTALPSQPGGANLIANGVENIVATVQTLAAAGAQRFLVPNMPDLGTTPGALGNAALSGLTALFNASLGLAMSALDAALPAEIVLFDTAAALQEIIANKAAYGFDVTDRACVDNLLNGQCNPATWVFWDGVHPTTRTHEILAAKFYAAIPEPGIALLLAVGLLGVLASGRRRIR